MTVIEFYDMEPASVDVKMNVALFKVGRNGLPKLYINPPEDFADSAAQSDRLR